MLYGMQSLNSDVPEVCVLLADSCIALDQLANRQRSSGGGQYVRYAGHEVCTRRCVQCWVCSALLDSYRTAEGGEWQYDMPVCRGMSSDVAEVCVQCWVYFLHCWAAAMEPPDGSESVGNAVRYAGHEQ
jgi:hypothetical protein